MIHFTAIKIIPAWMLLMAFSFFSFAQPPRSYRKQMKQKEKAAKEEKQDEQSNEKGLKEIKRLNKQLRGLQKAQQDADASGDNDASMKLQEKMDHIKGAINFREDKLQEKIVKDHRKIQSKETRKRMKKNAKKSNRINDNRREPFFVRWYRKWKD